MTIGSDETHETSALRRAFLRLQLFVGAIALMCVVCAYCSITSPDLGFDDVLWSDGRQVVASVDPGGAAERAGIAAGDVIVVDPTGPRPPRWSERHLYGGALVIARHIAAGSVPYTLEREGRRFEVSIQPGPATAHAIGRRLLHDLSLYTIAAVYLGMAALLARRPARDRDEPGRRLAAYGLAVVVPGFAVNDVWHGWPAWLVCWGAVCVNVGATTCATLLMRFAWSYPTRSPLVRSPWPTAIFAAIGAGAAVNSVLDGWGVIRSPLDGNRAQVTYDCVAFLLLVAGLVWQRRRADTVIAQRQASVLLAPFVITFLALLGLLVRVHTGTGIAMAPYLARTLFLLTLALPLGFAAAVARFRLFAIDALAPRAGVYGLVAAASVALYAIVIAAADVLLRPVFGRGSDAARWIAVPALVIAGAPARRLAERAVDRLFSRDQPRFLARCTELVAQLSQSGAAARLDELVGRALEVDVARTLPLAEIVGADRAARLRADLGRRGAVRVVEARDPEAVDRLLAAGIEVLVDVPARDEVLAIAAPLATRLLGETERHALIQVGKAIAGALAQRDARASIARDAESARRQIAMELHDGVGATLAAAQLFTQLAKRAPAAEGDDDPLRALERTLSDGLADLRLAVWSLADDPTSWDQVLARVRRHMGDVCRSAGIALDLTITGEWPAEPSAAARLALLRLLQEATNNVIRHARAKRVICCLSAEDDAIHVHLEDDGVGLPAEGARGGGRGLGNMARRVESLGGTFEIGAAPGGGARIRAQIPLRAGLA